MKAIRLLLVIMLASSFVRAQQAKDYPVIGEPIPDLRLQNIQDYTISDISMSDLRGRHVIIDLWHRHCSTCIAFFPKIDSLYNQFKDRMEFFLIGLEDSQGLEQRYRLAKERNKMTIPWLIDSALYNMLNPGRSAPHLIWIDDRGIVRAVTSTITASQITEFLNNRSFAYRDASYQKRMERNDPQSGYRWTVPFMFEGNGGLGHQIRYRSLLLDFMPNEMPSITFPISIRQAKRWFPMLGNRVEGVIDLTQLYRFAYLGFRTWSNKSTPDHFGDTSVYKHYYRQIQFELTDKERSLFEVEHASGKNKYLYSLVLPENKTTEEDILEIIRKDLAINFGFEAVVEVKPMPYWSIQLGEQALEKIMTKGEEKNYKNQSDINKQVFINWAVGELMERLFYKIQYSQPPIINDTGFKGGVDITIEDGLLSDFGYIRKSLETHGIFLVKKEKLFKVLTIKSSNK